MRGLKVGNNEAGLLEAFQDFFTKICLRFDKEFTSFHVFFHQIYKISLWCLNISPPSCLISSPIQQTASPCWSRVECGCHVDIIAFFVYLTTFSQHQRI
jgi:hypothetical protein